HIGIFVGSAVTGAAIRGNSIAGNGEIGIDLLGNVGPTANDLNDGDTGANNLQNFPVVSSARAGGGSTFVDGTLNSSANTSYALDFFANTSCNAANFGGQRYLGSMNVTTIGNNASFQATLPAASTVGEFITTTATDASGNTS